MRAWISATAGGLVLLLAGCGGREPVSSGWSEPGHYGYTLQSMCGERFVLGTMRLTVKDGKVVDATGLDEPGRSIVQVARDRAGLENLPSLKDLITEYETAVRDGADEATAEFDPGDGHATRIDLDIKRNATDDETCYRISDYQLLD